VEALLVKRLAPAPEYFRVPIDECYKLVGGHPHPLAWPLRRDRSLHHIGGSSSLRSGNAAGRSTGGRMPDLNFQVESAESVPIRGDTVARPEAPHQRCRGPVRRLKPKFHTVACDAKSGSRPPAASTHRLRQEAAQGTCSASRAAGDRRSRAFSGRTSAPSCRASPAARSSICSSHAASTSTWQRRNISMPWRGRSPPDLALQRHHLPRSRRRLPSSGAGPLGKGGRVSATCQRLEGDDEPILSQTARGSACARTYFDQLQEFKVRNSLPTWEQALERLLSREFGEGKTKKSLVRDAP